MKVSYLKTVKLESVLRLVLDEFRLCRPLGEPALLPPFTSRPAGLP